MSLAELAIGGMVGSAMRKSAERERQSQLLDEQKEENLRHLQITVRTVFKTSIDDNNFIQILQGFLDSSNSKDEQNEILISAYQSYISKGNSNDDFYLNILDKLDKKNIDRTHLDDLEEIKKSKNDIELSKLAENGEQIVQEELDKVVEYFKTISDDKLQLLMSENNRKQSKIINYTKSGIIAGGFLASLAIFVLQVSSNGFSDDGGLGPLLLMIGSTSLSVLPVDGILKSLFKTIGLKTFNELEKDDIFIKELSSKVEEGLSNLFSIDDIVSFLTKIEDAFNHEALISHKIFPKILDNLSDHYLEKIPTYFLEKHGIYYEKTKNPENSLQEIHLNRSKRKIKDMRN